MDTWPRLLGTVGFGVALLWITPWIVRGFVALERMLGRALLSPVSASQRVRDLEQSRSQAVTSSNEQLRRIERDLHDGTQARLVALAMHLGQAKEDLDSADPVAAERARKLIAGAHQQTKETLTELRDIARGIHPPILDNGLEPALTSLGAALAAPGRARLRPAAPPFGRRRGDHLLLHRRTADERRQAQRCERDQRAGGPRGDRIVFSVTDDGWGGAMLGGGSGLDGVQRRLATVDGTLEVDSPLGGPTTAAGSLPYEA